MPPVKLSLHYVSKVRTKQDTSETTSTTSRVRSRQPVLRSLHFGSTSVIFEVYKTKFGIFNGTSFVRSIYFNSKYIYIRGGLRRNPGGFLRSPPQIYVAVNLHCIETPDK